MQFENIIVSQKETAGILTLNRPAQRNALDPQTWNEILMAVKALEHEKSVRVVIVTGAGGKAFASGADITSLQARKPLQILEGKAQEVLNRIENLTKPVIAAIDGFALGGGCELAIACDMRIATKRSRLGFPEVTLGIMPGAGGTQRLQRLVGFGKAKELILTGEIINADEALKIGLINKLIEQPEDLMKEAMVMARKIADRGPVAVSLAKMAINLGANTSISDGMVFEKMAQTVLFTTKDRDEGLSAFLEKRKPEFKGE